MVISSYLKDFAEKFPVEFTKISNVPAVIMKNSNSPSAGIVFSFRDGVLYEKQEQWGISHFIEHILLRGTEKFPTLYDISRQVEGIGGYISAYSTRDMTAFWLKVPPGYEAHSLELIEEVITRASLKEEFIDSERIIIQQERHRELSNIPLYSSLMVENLLLLPEPVARYPVGRDDFLNNINPFIIKEHLKNFYHKNNLSIAVGGNISEDFKEILGNVLNRFPSGPSAREINFKIQSVLAHKKIVHMVSPHKSQITLTMGWTFPVRTRREFVAWRILNTLLTVGYTSLLNNLLREKENITYLCTGKFNAFKDTGIFKINLALADKNLGRAINLIDNLLEDIKNEKIPRNIFNEAIVRHASNTAFLLEDSLTVSKVLAENLVRRNVIFSFSDYFKELEEIDLSMVSSMIKDYLTEERRKIFLVSGSDEIMRLFPETHTLELTKDGVIL